ncbi:MAG TPA: PrgI family protein [Candidatus Paceibacterota bacterium]
MKFQVPQFIEVEDKIFGPLTLKQFIYLAGAAGFSFIIYKIAPFFIGVVLVVPILLFGVALAFYKINNKPFIFVVEAAVKYFFSAKLYIWRKENRQITPTTGAEGEKESMLYLPKLSNSKLRDLTWSLDIKEGVNPGTAEMKNRV